MKIHTRSMRFLFAVACGLSATKVAHAQSTATITMNGVDVTGQTVTVAVGQQINLQSQDGTQDSWLFNGIDEIVVGGRQVNQACPNVSPSQSSNAPSCVSYSDASANTSSTTFYFLQTGEPTLYYSYYDSNNVYRTASVSFKIVGPTSVVLSPAYATNDPKTNTPISIWQDSTPSHYWNVQLGNSSSNVSGIVINASAVQPVDFGGSFNWIQQISYNFQYDAGGNTYTCSTVSGLDDSQTYPFVVNNNSVSNPFIGNSALDSPELIVPDTLTTAGRSFQAVMELDWQSATQNSIPVRVGTVYWGYYSDVMWNGTAFVGRPGQSLGTDTFDVEYENPYTESWSDVVPSPTSDGASNCTITKDEN